MADVTAKLALPAPRAERIAIQIARVLGLALALFAAFVLAGWRFGSPLAQPVAGFIAMQPNAALGVFLAGLGLFLFTFYVTQPMGRGLGLVLFVLGAITFSQDVLGTDIGIDAVLLHPGTASPAVGDPTVRIPPGMSRAVAVRPRALSAGSGRIGSAVSQVLAVVMLAQVLIMLTGHTYGVATAYYPFPFTTISLFGAVATALLAFGLLLATPSYGIAGAILEPSPAGEMLRRLLPGILILPLVIGWFADQAEAHTYYDSSATLALFAVASIVVLAAFAWSTIGAVRRADRDRNEALVELRGQREWLSTTLGSIGEGVIATDPSGSVLVLNKVAHDLTGWNFGEARGRPIWEIFRIVDETSRKPHDDPA